MSAQTIIRSYEAIVDDVKPGERAVISKIGGMAVDRHRTIISHHGISLDAYRKNPIVLHEHGRCPTRGTLPVGRNQWVKIDGERMIAKTVFRDDPYSSELFSAYKDGWMRGWSINVLAHEASPPTEEEMRAAPALRRDCDLIYRRTELVEYSTTSMPSHRDALTLMVSRGIWVPDEALAEAERYARQTSVAMPGLPGEPRTMTDSGGLAAGGAAAKPTFKGDDDDEDEEEEEPAKKRRPAASDEDEDDEDEPDDDEDEDDEDEEEEAPPKAKAPKRRGRAERFLTSNPAAVSQSATGDDDEPEDEEEEEEAKAPPKAKAPKSRDPDGAAPATVARFIRKRKGKFYVVSEEGKNLGGPYGSRAEAEKRLGQVEYFKHQGRSAPPPPAPTERHVAPDGDGWAVAEPDGATIARFRDRADAEECLRAMAAPNGFERVLLQSMAEQRAWLEERADDLIARIELRVTGRV